LVVANAVHRLVVYFTESAKYASSAVTRFRRSDFIEARYAFSFVLANFGIAMAAKIPMITTTIRSSIRVKPLRFIRQPPRRVKSRTIINEYSAANITKPHPDPGIITNSAYGARRNTCLNASIVPIAYGLHSCFL